MEEVVVLLEFQGVIVEDTLSSLSTSTSTRLTRMARVVSQYSSLFPFTYLQSERFTIRQGRVPPCPVVCVKPIK